MDQQAIFTEPSTEISSTEVAQYLQSVAVVDRQATFTDTSTEISSMYKPLTRILPPISSLYEKLTVSYNELTG